MSGPAPKWWKNPDFIDPAQLCALPDYPDYLEQMKDRIDKWVNSISPKENTRTEKSFVIESKFEGKLKATIQGIPADTEGVVVIKDDFKTIKIEFIDNTGKKTQLNISPEELPNFVD